MTNDATPYAVASALISDVGCSRATNEDSGRSVTPHDKAVATAKGVLTIVADGMGGHAAGEVASQLAVATVQRAYYEHPGEPHAALLAAFDEANRHIHRDSRADSRLEGMGTTCTALVIRGVEAFCAHVGDSRVYLYRGGSVYQMTEDHSAVQRMVMEGVLSTAEARRHQERNVLLRALGTHESVEVSTWDQPLSVRPGDRFLLCSDGLHDLVGEEELGQAAALVNAHDGCQQLIELAKARGGHDNITVGIVQVDTARAAASHIRETRQGGLTPTRGGRS